MLRFVNICLVLGLVALAYVIYEVKYEARGLDEEIAALKKDIDAERDSVSVLRAEWSLLNRPERIERLAQKYLKLEPAKPDQLVALDTLSDSDFDRAKLAVASQTAPQPASGVGAKPDLAKAAAGKSETAKADAARPLPVKATNNWTASVSPGPVKVQAPVPRPRAPMTASAAGN